MGFGGRQTPANYYVTLLRPIQKSSHCVQYNVLESTLRSLLCYYLVFLTRTRGGREITSHE
jgi:hypothetical protein